MSKKIQGVLVREKYKHEFKKMGESFLSGKMYNVNMKNQKFVYWHLDFATMFLLQSYLTKRNFLVGSIFVYEKHMLLNVNEFFTKELVLENLGKLVFSIYNLVFLVVRFFFMQVLGLVRHINHLSGLKATDNKK